MNEKEKELRLQITKLQREIVALGARVLELEVVPIPSPPVKKKLESLIQQEIRLELSKEPLLYMPRNNVGVLESEGRMVRFGLGVGSSDLIGLLAPHGRFIALEIKQPGKHPTPEQVTFLEAIRLKGGFGAVVRSASEARAAIERAKKGLFE